MRSLLLAAAALLAAADGGAKVDGTVIGIDLGTTYSCVAVYKNGIVEIIPNDQGNRIMPSYVAFTDKERLVGEAAKNQAALNPGQTLFDIKRFIGRSFKDTVAQTDIKLLPFQVVADTDGTAAVSVKVKGVDKLVKPEEISAAVLAKLKESAEKYLGQEVKHAVVSVPAFFNDAQRKATKDAGTIAGLEILRVINEPTAAAVAYGFENQDAQDTVLVYDLGGGTCDVSVLKVNADGVFEVLATAGDPHLGGEDFDQRVMEHLMASFKKKHKKDVSKDQQALQKLRTEVEKVKRKLSTVPQAPVKIEALQDNVDLAETLTRAQFEKLNVELFKRTLEPVQQVLQDAGLKKSDISKVVLAGGSARIPKVQQLLSEFFDGKELTRSINPDEAIAHGAAIQAASLSSQGLEQEMSLIDVTPLSLGIQTAGGFMTTVIARSTALPAEGMMVFSTHKDNQEKATVKVFEGERSMAKNNHLIGSFEISGITSAPRGMPQIAVTFKVDASGMLTVQAVDRGSGKSEELSVAADANGRLSKEQIQDMIKEAEMFADADQTEIARVEARMALKLFVRKLRVAADASGEEDATKLQGVAADLEDWLSANPDAEAEELQEKQEEIDATMPDLEELLEGAGASASAGAEEAESSEGGGEIDMEGHDEL